MIKIGGQFSGVGAFDAALNRLKIPFENVYQAEWDKYARQTYLANNEQPEYYVEDVNDTPIEEITEKHGSLDIVMFSPPCQAFSLAGKRQGKNDLKGRGILFFNSLEFIEKNKPRFFIFENVKGLLSDDGGNTFNEWLNFLGGKSINGSGVLFSFEGSVPYHIYYKVLNAKDFGVPQNRERIFIIGIRDDQDNSFIFPKEEFLEKRLKDVLESEVDDKYYLSEKMLELITYAKNGSIEVANINKGGQKGIVVDANGTHIGCLSATDYKLPKLIMEEPKVIQLNQSKESGGVQPYQQNRVYDINGIMTTLDTGSCSRNILLEPKIIQLNNPVHSNDRVYSADGLSPTLNTMQGGNRQPFIEEPISHSLFPRSSKTGKGGTGHLSKNDGTSYCVDTGCSQAVEYSNTIRKLTPIECFRLMDFPDSLVYNAKKAGVSDSQLYKQAGNSIVVSVLCRIIERLKL